MNMNTLDSITKTGLLVLALIVVSACSEGTSENSGVVSAPGQVQTGIAGSTARMVIDDNYLYAISGNTIQLFDISEPATPLPWNQVVIDWDIQTLFAYENYLLVGAADGIHILDNTDRASPQYVGDFQHAVTRDPVVAQNNVAYATLRRDDSQAGNGIVNQLNVIDINDVTNPVLVQTQELEGPSGLAVKNDRLYVCDGTAGLKIFDITDRLSPNVNQILANLQCNDVIATDDTLHVIGPDAYSQYNTSLAPRPQLMSTIKREPAIYLVDR